MSKGKLIANTPRPRFKGLSGLGLWYVQLQITAEQLVFTSDHMHMHISKACAVGGAIDRRKTYSGKKKRMTREMLLAISQTCYIS